MGREPLRNIVIVGGGIAGWMTAAALARALAHRAPLVRLIDIPGDASDWESLGAAESSIPLIRMFHAILGIDEDDLIRKTNACFKLGVEFSDWGAPGRAYVHPYGEFGAGMESAAFHHHWLKMRSLGDAAALDDYSLSAVAARLGRFSRPVADPSSVFSTHAYALNLDAGLYARYLRDHATARGVRSSTEETIDIRLRGDDGCIDAIVLASGEQVQADLFIDCTGSRGLLIEQALKTGYEEWAHWLPCDRAVVAASDSEDPFPLTRAARRDAGWRLHIPLQDGAGNALVYSSTHLSDDEAASLLLASLDAAPAHEPRFVQQRSGRRKKLWNKNCAAIGAAAGFLDPLESTGLQLIQSGVSRLAGLLPDRDNIASVAAEYDRLVGTGFERLRDLVTLHYKLAAAAAPAPASAGARHRRSDSDFWRNCREMSVPDSLVHKMRLFESRGRVALIDEETFLEPSWISAFIGQGVTPRRYDPLADMVDVEVVRESMKRMRDTIRRAANSMPSHRAFLAGICATEAGSERRSGAGA